ncbi:MAG: amidohydrolase family protein [Rhodospirillaceae bacterium]|jgi:N-acyl-D-aspartate/D-glutamate deacylase|nr:amidohydrolase family protein [Rhodospirillaceae bacterium]MBT4691165.1 amidohydrolase family protein [Rhodospirillaceae bacterium]MBT5525303.1 amidohydrolase family protein [Rhodospirillaceae bacterium]MBT5877872.1 amidohydrolase family protein [Rhodospirillaceae bacterium]MBT6587419.1 amidohydrolase family protein [Rhodospirillaceae bacterium]
MAYDLIVKNGMIIDGSGGARYRGDIGVKDGKIATIGRINAPSDDIVDAEGHVVSPGFVDGHTHMDAQIFWDSLGTCSCYHGVTSVVMGNCGFTLAPCREEEVDYVFRNLERAEDISRAAMSEGITWQWETYPEYLDVIDKLPKGMNYAGYVGHSALRTYVMGERAFDEQATEDDLKAMVANVQDSVKAGAIGFSTSRSTAHLQPDNRPVASRIADFSEVAAIVNGMGDIGAGIFQLAMDRGTNEELCAHYDRIVNLSKESGRPITFGSLTRRSNPGAWKDLYDIVEQGNLDGARIFTQVHAREINVILSFQTQLPFDNWPVWSEMRKLPLEQQKAALRDGEMKQKLIHSATTTKSNSTTTGGEARPPEWEYFYHMDSVTWPHRSMADIARERGVEPIEAMIDIALEHDLKTFFRQPISNEDEEGALAIMKHPRSVVTFSDSGAHVSQIMDSSLQTHLLSHWVRERQEFSLEQAVRMITYDTATSWGFHDRGLLREGMAADIVVFDPERITPQMPTVEHDLPAGAQRLKQLADGIAATIINGQVVLRDNVHTGALPGQLLRGPLART